MYYTASVILVVSAQEGKILVVLLFPLTSAGPAVLNSG